MSFLRASNGTGCRKLFVSCTPKREHSRRGVSRNRLHHSPTAFLYRAQRIAPLRKGWVRSTPGLAHAAAWWTLRRVRCLTVRFQPGSTELIFCGRLRTLCGSVGSARPNALGSIMRVLLFLGCSPGYYGFCCGSVLPLVRPRFRDS